MRKLICTLDNHIHSPHFVYFSFEQDGKKQERKASVGLVNLLKRNKLFYPGAKFVSEIYLDNYKIRPYDIGKDANLTELEYYLSVIEENKSGLSEEEYKIMLSEVKEDIRKVKENQ